MEIREEIRKIVKEELSKVQIARDFAGQIHKGQERRSTGKPYIVHPVGVYEIVKDLGLSKSHQILALLHDTYEDSNNPRDTLRKISKKFGNKIVKLVQLMSHKKRDYNDYLYNLANKSKLAFDVKLADMINNIEDKPKPEQKQKYKDSILFILDKGIKIKNKKLKNKLFNLLDI